MLNLGVLRKSFGIYIVSNVINAAVPFLLLPFLTVYLTPAEYGLVAMFQVLMNSLLPFFGFSLNASVSRQYFDKEDSNFSAYVTNALLVLLTGTAVFGGIFLLSGQFVEKFSDFPKAWLWSVVLFTFSQLLSEVLLTTWRVKNKAMNFGLFRIFRTGMDMGLSLYFVIVLKRSWEGRIEGQLAAMTFFAMIAIFYLYRGGYLTNAFNKKYYKDVVSYGLPLIPHMLGAIIITYSDRLFITNMVGMHEMGLYAVGYQIGMIIGLFQNSFNHAWQPWIFGRIKKDDEREKGSIVKYTYLYFVVILLMALILSMAGSFVVKVMTDSDYSGSTPFIAWIAFGFAFNGMYKMVVNYLFYLKKTRIIGISTFATATLNLVLNYVLITANGPVGAAQATTISFFVQFILIWYASSKAYKMPWFSFNQKSRNDMNREIPPLILVAIPKSASTSLMKTLGDLHYLDAQQDMSWLDNPIPKNSNYLHNVHSDIREISIREKEMFMQKGKLYKQHIFPSENNVEKLSEMKKVILLREPKSICLAYRRGMKKNVHTLLPGFDPEMSEEVWMKNAHEKGLMKDLEFFFNTWTQLENKDDVLIIRYEELIESTEKVVRKVEEFWGVPITEDEIVLAKERYSRRTGLEYVFFIMKLKIRNVLVKTFELLGMKNAVKNILGKGPK